MKKIICIAIILVAYISMSYAQSAYLDTSDYHIFFFDDFNYTVPIPTSGSDLITSTVPATYATGTTVGGSTFSSNWHIMNDIPQSDNNEWFRSDNVIMSAPGILRILATPTPTYTVFTGGSLVTVNSYSGRFYSLQKFGYGIYEVKFKTHLPPGSPLGPGNGACWIGPDAGATEIDLPDVFTDVTGEFNVINWGFEVPGTLGAPHVGNYNTFYKTLSDDFHIFSCVWSPSGVIFYFDRVYYTEISYDNIRTFSNSDDFFAYAFQATIWTHNPTIDCWIDFDWVKVWKPNCKPDMEIDNSTTSVLTGSLFTGFHSLPMDLSRNNNISVGVTDPAHSPVSPDHFPATILEAASTTLLPNFVADQSTLYYHTKTATSSANTDSTCSLIYNGYFEIIPKFCGSEYDDIYYRASHGNDSSKNNGLEYDAINSAQFNNPVDHLHNTNGNYSIQVYPNPTQDVINISYPCTTNGQLEISIKDVSGRVRYGQSVNCMEGNNTQYSIDFSSFEKGVYFIELTLNSQHTVKKIVKL